MKKIISLFLCFLFIMSAIPYVKISASTIAAPVAEIIDAGFIKMTFETSDEVDDVECYNLLQRYYDDYGWIDENSYVYNLTPETTYFFRVYNELTEDVSSVTTVTTLKRGPDVSIKNKDSTYVVVDAQPNCLYWVYEYVEYYGDGSPASPEMHKYAHTYVDVTSFSGFETIKGLKPNTKYVIFSDGQGINDVGVGKISTFTTLEYPRRPIPEDVTITQEHEKDSAGKPTSYVKLTAHASNYSDDQLSIGSSGNPAGDYYPNSNYRLNIYAKAISGQYSTSYANTVSITTIKRGMWEKVGALSLTSKSSTSITVSCAEETYTDILEYSVDGENWQTSNTFENLDPNTEYTVLARHNPELNQEKYDDGTAYCNYYYGPTEPYYYSKLSVTTMKQTEAPTISKIADTSIVCDTNDNTKYRIRKANSTTYTENTTGTFTGLTKQTTYYISKKNTSDSAYDWSNEVKVKTKGSAKAAPSVSVVSTGIDNITLTSISGCEYSKNGTSWQESNVFTGLTANTSYTLYARYAETDDYVAGNITTITAKTNKENAGAVITFGTAEVDAYKVIVNATVSNFTLEYSKDNVSWQDSNTFTGLSANTTYVIYVRTKETEDYAAGDIKTTTVKTKKASVKPVATRVENTKITLKYISGYKYKISGQSWQTSNVFTGLSANTSYTFYQINASNTDYGTSLALTVKTKTNATPTIPSKYSVPTAKEENITNTTITLDAISGYEYKINNGSWQTSNVFTGLSPYTEYTFYQRIAETTLAGYSNTSSALVVRTLKNTNSNIPSRPIFYEKYTNSETVKSFITIYTVDNCEYSVDGGNIWVEKDVSSDKLTFENLTPGQTYTIYARYYETDDTYCSEKSEGLSITLDKALVSKPTKISESDLTITDTTIKINNYNNKYKYSLDTISWTNTSFTGIFTDLSPATEYKIYRKLKETSTTYESAVSDALTVKTDLSTPNAPEKPTITKYTSSSITIKTLDGCEYCIVEKIYDGSDEDLLDWKQTSSSTYTFTNLTYAHQYYVYQRYYATNTSYVSKSSYIGQKTDLKTPLPPTIYPIVENKTDTSLEFEKYSTYDYGLLDIDKTENDIVWQSSNCFYGLLPAHEYSLYIRIKAVENDSYASNAVLAIASVKTNKSIPGIPDIPKIIDDSDTTVTLEKISGYEYSKDNGKTYQTSNKFTGLTPNTTYYFCQRVAGTSTSEVSEWSECNVFTTDIVKLSPPSTPTMLSRTDKSITVRAVTGCQYKINDGDWQDNNTFTGLSPNTSYKIYTRYKDTPTALASDASEPLTVSTTRSKYSGEVLNPVYETKTAYTITIKKIEGYEYRIDNGDWQTSNVFTGLTVGETYEISQRVAQTQTTEASNISDYIYVTTAKIKHETPNAPICISKTDNQITLQVMYDNVVYSINGSAWTTYNVFTNLQPNTVYRIKQKMLENDEYLESDVSNELVIRTKDISPTPTIVATEDIKIKLYIPDGFSVRIEGITDWTKNTVISGLTPGTEYTIEQNGDADLYVSSKITIKTKINPVPEKPEEPIVYGYSSDVIKIDEEKGYEYSLDGIIWQDNGVFENLKSDTEYTIYKREKETETTPASEIIEIKVKTTAKTIYGDVNNDGKINAKDSLLLKKYIAGHTVKINLMAADIDKNNSVNTKDILDIQKIIFNS